MTTGTNAEDQAGSAASGLRTARAPAQAHRWALGTFAVVLAANLFQDRYLYWDSYLDLAAGRLIFHSGIPHHEVFTVEAQGRSWIDQQWLAHLLTYVSWREGGYAGAALLSSAAVAAAFALLAALMITQRVHPQRALLWTGIAYLVCLGNTVIRAQALAYPLWVALLWGFASEWHQPLFRRRTWFAVPLLVVWANLHGSVLLAAGCVAVAAAVRGLQSQRAGRVQRAYFVLGAAAAMSPFATPYGIHIVSYYHALIGNPVIKQYILEWSPPSFGNPFSIPFIGLLLATAVIAGYTAQARRTDRASLALVVFTGVVATQAVRYAPWFGFTAAAFDAQQLARTRKRPESLPHGVLVAGAVFAVVGMTIAIAVLARTSDAQFERLQPRAAMAAAAAYGAAHPSARILADDSSSSAMLWRYPALYGRVAFDARLEQFSQTQLRRWFRYMTVTGTDWKDAMNGYDVLVITRDDQPRLAHAALQLPGWHVIERDAKGLALAHGPR